MNIAILGDAHAGVRDGNQLMMSQQLDYLVDEFVPYLIANGITIIIQTGDIFDVRKHTNTAVLSDWKERFFDLLERHGIHLYVYIGNHDMFYKNTITPNSVTEHLSSYKNITIIEQPMDISIGSRRMLIVPWICSDNEQECMNAIKTSTSEVCFGHFEIKGAKMESSTCTDGLPLSTFDRFTRCISGHFHIAGEYENVQYVGTPYQMSWGDYGIEKGFWVMDTGTLDMEFIKNPHDLYHKITYNEDRDMSIFLKADHTDHHIKVVIEHREDFKKYEKWLLKVEAMGAASLTIVEPYMDRNSEDSNIGEDGELNIISTDDIIKEYISDIYPEKKDPLTKMMLGLHSTARSIHG